MTERRVGRAPTPAQIDALILFEQATRIRNSPWLKPYVEFIHMNVVLSLFRRGWIKRDDGSNNHSNQMPYGITETGLKELAECQHSRKATP